MSRRGRGGKNKQHRNDGRQDNRGDSQTGRTDNRPNQRNNQPNQRQASASDGAGGQVDRQPGRSTFPSITQPRRNLNRPMLEASVAPRPGSRTFKVVFFDTMSQAKSDIANLKNLADQCDQLNIVVRAEGTMDDPDLNSVGHLFCGAAWALIHERRKTDGWYDTTHE